MRLEIRLSDSITDSEARLDIMIDDMEQLEKALTQAVSLGRVLNLSEISQTDMERIWNQYDIEKGKTPEEMLAEATNGKGV